MGTSSKAIHGTLLDTARNQHGLFTAKEAVHAGYADSVHGYHVRNGDWLKIQRGIYRLAEIAEPPSVELVAWSIWSRNRNGIPQGVYCRETALEIHGVIKREGGTLHMMVPTTFRRNCEIPGELKLYKEDLTDREIEQKEGFAVTTLARTVRDIMKSCTNPNILKALDRTGGIHASVSPDLPMADQGLDGRTGDGGYVAWDDHWDGPSTPPPQWSDGKTFEQALNAGED
jgi:predicted transcriptional regulator of viral defense system